MEANSSEKPSVISPPTCWTANDHFFDDAVSAHGENHVKVELGKRPVLMIVSARGIKMTFGAAQSLT